MGSCNISRHYIQRLYTLYSSLPFPSGFFVFDIKGSFDPCRHSNRDMLVTQDSEPSTIEGLDNGLDHGPENGSDHGSNRGSGSTRLNNIFLIQFQFRLFSWSFSWKINKIFTKWDQKHDDFRTKSSVIFDY